MRESGDLPSHHAGQAQGTDSACRNKDINRVTLHLAANTMESHSRKHRELRLTDSPNYDAAVKCTATSEAECASSYSTEDGSCKAVGKVSMDNRGYAQQKSSQAYQRQSKLLRCEAS
jgi:hypothetical protein